MSLALGLYRLPPNKQTKIKKNSKKKNPPHIERGPMIAESDRMCDWLLILAAEISDDFVDKFGIYLLHFSIKCRHCS